MFKKIKHALFFVIISMLGPGIFITLQAQVTHKTINDFFNTIRDNTAQLTAFFSQMPKGGDLHHHFSGSVYAETYIDFVVSADYFIHKSTLEVEKDIALKDNPGEWIKLSDLANQGLLALYKEKLVRKWSVKDFNPADGIPEYQHAFATFSNFGIAAQNTLEQGLIEIKQRAISENVSYIETTFTPIPCENKITELADFDSLLRHAQQKKDEITATRLLDSLFTGMLNKELTDCALRFNTNLETLHTKLSIDDSSFIMRYQNYVLRNREPVLLFKNLITAFESAKRSALVVGVNIVAPEYGEVSMKDYWLHTLMFKFCHTKYPGVKYSMHAGELFLGLVKPEELTWHINAAIYTAGANRIGHGADMAYEKDSYSLLAYMSHHHLAVEICLTSNEIILNIKNDEHPIMLYKQFNVPIVISTDDAGVFRSSHTQQFVLLAKRYKNISYNDIKQFVFNSISYSFIEENELKQKMLTDLKKRFQSFENKILKNVYHY